MTSLRRAITSRRIVDSEIKCPRQETSALKNVEIWTRKSKVLDKTDYRGLAASFEQGLSYAPALRGWCKPNTCSPRTFHPLESCLETIWGRSALSLNQKGEKAKRQLTKSSIMMGCFPSDRYPLTVHSRFSLTTRAREGTSSKRTRTRSVVRDVCFPCVPCSTTSTSVCKVAVSASADANVYCMMRASSLKPR
jgi:hypothetical protein